VLTTLIAIVITFDHSRHLAVAKRGGQAFPIEAENFAIDRFQKINPSIVSPYVLYEIIQSFSQSHSKQHLSFDAIPQ
jgi:hypothetical protein